MRQNKKSYIISLFKKYGEYDESINRDNIDTESIDKIYTILTIKDEKKRDELLNKYKKEECKKMEERRKKAEELLTKIRKLSNQIKESKSGLKDSKDLEDLEKQILIS